MFSCSHEAVYANHSKEKVAWGGKTWWGATHWLHGIADPLTNLPLSSLRSAPKLESLKERSGEGGGVEITRRTRLRERMHVRTIVGARDAFSGKMRARPLLTQKLYKILSLYRMMGQISHLEPLIHLVWTGVNWYRLNVWCACNQSAIP